MALGMLRESKAVRTVEADVIGSADIGLVVRPASASVGVGAC